MFSVRRGNGPSPGAVLIVALVWLAVPVLSAGAAAQDALVAQGKQLFEQKCSGCHGLGSGDRPTGPDLAGITEKAEPDWLARFIREPDKVIASGDPTATALLAKFHLAMPNLGLSAAEVDALLAYLSAPKVHASSEAPVPASAGTGGDAARGEALFIGAVAMTNGGAPCLGCHGLGGHGLGGADLGMAGGASYGPDLTTMYRDFGADGVASTLADLSFPSMTPIFAKHPLTEQEQADLGAFLARVDAAAAPQIVAPLAWQVGIVVVAFFALLAVLGWRRLQGVRLPLLEQVKKQGGHRA
jgi:mono/diheme cytochrome c family protein